MSFVYSLWDLTGEIWHTFDEAAIYIIFGVFIAGLIQVFINKDTIARYLSKNGFKSVFLAALFGVPMPLCSCGVIPTAISLRKNGASKGATVSFLISTPESGIDSMTISYALLDPLMTVYRPVSAFITAIIAGVGENIFGVKEAAAIPAPQSDCACIGHGHSGREEQHCLPGHHSGSDGHEERAGGNRIWSGMRYAFIELLGDLAKWLVIGIIIGGIISYFVPASFIENYLGSGWQAMLIMLVVGIPLYICASASTPIAASLIAKGMSPGVALVFLLAGPATNAAGILAIGKFLGRRSVVIYLVSIAVCAVGLGLLLNWIYSVSGLDIKTTLGTAGEFMPHYIKVIAAVILILLMGYAYYRTKKSKCADNCSDK